jgi:hypothetical protein
METVKQKEDLFSYHELTGDGQIKALTIAFEFRSLLATLERLVPEGTELEVTRQKLQEACFFAKRGMALANCAKRE